MTISAKIIADSISPEGIRLVTVQCRYPRFIHSEVMTHRVFSRNASSSRAIPIERLIKDVLDDPVIPMHWGKNQPGMQANEEHAELIKAWSEFSEGQHFSNEKAWLHARNQACAAAKAFSSSGYHKQIVNRLLEPFCHINTLITSTEWSNFFALRCHPDAQPEMRILAENIKDAMVISGSRPRNPGQWHLPYVDFIHDATKHSQDPEINDLQTAIRVSVARCARVSYLTQEGRLPNVEDDLKLYDRLVGSKPLHASPAEHQATPDKAIKGVRMAAVWERPNLHGNFRGYIQYRKTLPGECQ